MDSSLYVVCQNNNLIDIIKLLIQNGANINAKTGDGRTALQNVCQFYSNGQLVMDIVSRLLVEKRGINRANMGFKWKLGWTALHYLFKNSNNIENLIEVVKLFIEKGANVDLDVTLFSCYDTTLSQSSTLYLTFCGGL